MVSIGIGIKEDYKKTPLWVRILHNLREHGTKNSIFSKENNFDFINEDLLNLSKNMEDIKNYFNQEEEFLKEVVKTKTKQISKNKNHIIESLISISNDKEIEGMTETELKEFLILKTEKFLSRLKKDYGIKIYQYSIHLDEGHIDENGKEVKNIHIHIIHSNISLENGKSFSKQLFLKSKKGLDYRQDLISEEFEFKRGLKGSLNKHRHYTEVKREKQQEQELKDKIRVLEEENLKLQQITQEQQETIKNQEKTIEQMKQDLEDYENIYKQNKEFITSLNISNEDKKNLHKQNKNIIDFTRKLKKSENIEESLFNEIIELSNNITDILKPYRMIEKEEKTLIIEDNELILNQVKKVFQYKKNQYKKINEIKEERLKERQERYLKREEYKKINEDLENTINQSRTQQKPQQKKPNPYDNNYSNFGM